jgi:hypothetical protein
VTSLRRIPGVMLGYGEYQLQIKDSGNYTCVVNNYFGQGFGTVELRGKVMLHVCSWITHSPTTVKPALVTTSIKQ